MSIFRAYDIRGIFGKDLTNELAYRIGRAHATFTGAHTAVVGKDMRSSSEELKRALCLGLVEQGVDVIDIGLCSSPMLYFAVAHYGHRAGVMITASHNPGEYNGFKLTRENAIPIGADSGMPEIERLATENNFEKPQFRGRIIRKDITADYRSHVMPKEKLPRLKVVVDAGNAMGALEARFLQEIPELEIVPMYFELDGSFPNHEANPLNYENLRDLQKKVVEEKADVGIAFDGDADRVCFVDEQGEIVSSDFTTALIASKLLKENPGSKVLYDLRSSWAVPEMIRKHGGIPIMCKVGHAFIKRHMRQENALFAGELAGHYYFRDNFFSENTVMAAVHIFSMLKGKRKSELVRPLRKYHHSGEINSVVKDPDRVIAMLAEQHSGCLSISHLDGLRVEYDSHWFNVRKSNTEPLLRLIVEAKTREHMEHVRDELLGVIREKG